MGTGRRDLRCGARARPSDVDLTPDVVGRGDDELVGLAVEGNAPAFDEVYGRHLALTWRVARATTLSDDDAVGAVVDAFSAVLDADPREVTSLRSFFRAAPVTRRSNASVDGLSGGPRPVTTRTGGFADFPTTPSRSRPCAGASPR